ncbi:ATP-dependent DNA helicase [Trichonephila clavata]|uniref:ATP-dependent DNA helicase n=1 Tax=Trichonephila clavata TaxID=2740835 RepID=A0A8X6HU09_TRICU|nr:ATP-dependent DNA helicase [Trichonephila clavata]
MGKILQKCKLIVWDECTMAHKKSLEALDRSLQDLRGNTRPFGNALILLAGDFRQTLPVIPRSTPADEINASLKRSALWQHVKTLKLIKNMRVQLQNDRSAEISSNQLLDIGNRKVPVDLTSGKISLPHNFCNLVTSKRELVERVFPDIQTNFKNPNWLSERAILAAKNKDVYQLNNVIQSRIQNETVTYKSVDTVVEVDEAQVHSTIVSKPTHLRMGVSTVHAFERLSKNAGEMGYQQPCCFLKHNIALNLTVDVPKMSLGNSLSLPAPNNLTSSCEKCELTIGFKNLYADM